MEFEEVKHCFMCDEFRKTETYIIETAVISCEKCKQKFRIEGGLMAYLGVIYGFHKFKLFVPLNCTICDAKMNVVYSVCYNCRN